eukprot:g38201.t1
MQAIALLLAAALALAHQPFPCPGSPAAQRARCQIKLFFKNSCSEVLIVITNRIGGQYEVWGDPHNNGTYSLLPSSQKKEQAGSKYSTTILHTMRVAGPGSNVTDLQTWTLETGEHHKTCVVTGCSESQAFSIKDYGTNYCNLHNLYCMDSGCCPIHDDPELQYEETVRKCTEAKVSLCYVSPCLSSKRASHKYDILPRLSAANSVPAPNSNSVVFY